MVSATRNAIEQERLEQMAFYEDRARQRGFKAVAGIDEAGRGPLAGPVVAAACLIPPQEWIIGVDDSKKLTPLKREALYTTITTNERICYGIGIIAPTEIDRINIFQATIQAMLMAVANLAQQPDYLLVDGMKLPHPTISCEKIIGGDALSQAIAAASILAKVTRDRLMIEYHEQYPHYGFAQHKGYGTAEHLAALEKYGPCELHRRSFEPVKSLCIILETAVGPSQKAQDFESEALAMGAEHSQKVKAAPIASAYGSKDCAFRPVPAAVSRIIHPI